MISNKANVAVVDDEGFARGLGRLFRDSGYRVHTDASAGAFVASVI